MGTRHTSNGCTLAGMRWRPLSTRTEVERADEYDALHDGVPPWLAPGLTRWVIEVVRDAPYVDPAKTLHDVEQLLRFPLNWQRGVDTALGTLAKEFGENRSRALDIVDCLLMLTANQPGSWKTAEQLSSMLSAAGSAWGMGKDAAGTPCLHRRVEESSETAAKAAIDRPGNPGLHLRVAWHRVYGRDPDPSGAYREAVRAVEAAAKPVVTPNDSIATLGKMIKAMRDKPEKWTAELGSVAAVADMMGVLWTSQLDRHGTDDETVPLSASASQSEAAVHLAVTLVHWFQSGLVRLA